VEFDYAVAKNGFGEKGMEAFFEVNVNKENFGGLAKVYNQIDTFKDNIEKFKNDKACLANENFYDGVISNVEVSINAFKSNYENMQKNVSKYESYQNQCKNKGKAVKLNGNQNTGWSR
jgi:hypothetical protein